MSLPITIEGQKCFVTMPSLADFRTFKQFVARDLRREMGESIPSGLPDEELKRRYRLIDEECAAINPFSGETSAKLTRTPEGLAVLFHAWLRHENPSVTLTWVSELIERCEQNKPAALEGMRELRVAMTALIESKKNELEAKRAAAQTPATETPPSISIPSTSG